MMIVEVTKKRLKHCVKIRSAWIWTPDLLHT